MVFMNLFSGQQWRCRLRTNLWIQWGKERVGQTERVPKNKETKREAGKTKGFIMPAGGIDPGHQENQPFLMGA